MEDALGRAARVKAALDVKYGNLIKNGTIADIIPGTFGDHGHPEQPDVSIHLGPSQADDEFVQQIWRETSEYRDQGVDVRIYYYKPGQKDPTAFRG